MCEHGHINLNIENKSNDTEEIDLKRNQHPRILVRMTAIIGLFY